MRHFQTLMRAFAAVLAVGIAAPATYGQGEPINGMREARLRAHAIVGATVVTQPGTTLENATIVIRDGVIEAVGADVAIPGDARVWDAKGMMVYPGLIEPALMVEPGELPEGSGEHWNARVRPQVAMADQSPPDEEAREGLRSIGVTATVVYPSNGAFAGSGVVIATAGGEAELTAYRDRAPMLLRFETGGFRSGGGYPGSLMGAIALARQTLMDAQWYQRCREIYEADPTGQEPPMHSDALSALGDVLNRRQQVLFEVEDELDAVRAANIMEEFNLDYMLLGSGMEFRRLDEVAALGVPILLPVDYPDRPDIDSVDAAERLSLRELQTWEQAPTNPRRLHEAGVTFAFTTFDLNNRDDYFGAIRSAVRHGLDEDAALAAVTTTPAQLYGLDRVMGTIAPGKVANLVMTEGKLFDREMTVRDTWIDGVRYEINAIEKPKLAGKGTMHIHPTAAVEAGDYPIEFNFQSNRVTVTGPAAAEEDDAPTYRARTVSSEADLMSFVVESTPFGTTGYSRFSGTISGDEILGVGVHPDGSQFRFTINIEERTDPTANGDNRRGNRGARRGGRGVRGGGGEAPGGQDQDAPAAETRRRDPVSGDWTIVLEVEQAPEPIEVSVRLTLNEDGAVEGDGEVMGQAFEITRGSFDESSGELELHFPGMAGEDVTLTADVSRGGMTGTMASANFEAEFSGSRTGAGGQEGDGGDDEGESDFFTMPPAELPVPLGAYGLMEQPQPQSVLVTNATIWTSGPDGIIRNGYLAVRDGKVEAVGAGDPPPSGGYDVTIDASGRHVTPGLFDAHSHTGVSGGVNEMAQTNTAEVSIQSVVDPDDINWYRQLAGGLTVANQLHGSANPIGGQNSVVKLKWGGSAEDFIIDDAIAGIKFALGENVIRSQGRYPDTRMGVETFIRDAFTAARQYEKDWNKYLNLPADQQARTYPPRRDIEMETLVEILNGERLVHCHSYRQDEILMLMRVAEDFGFTIGTFQHVLEGYKVAEVLAEHGAGASTFSDWWAYKVEAYEAIPYNGALMSNVGVLVTFNSDSSELARRMNTEAAKAVRYGGAEPPEALAFVTSNSARQFRVDHRMGSLQPGKDADFVIWSGDPLSTMTRCEQTWIEGAKYFDVEADKEMQTHANAERQRIIQKIFAMAHGEVSAEDEEEEADE